MKPYGTFSARKLFAQLKANGLIKIVDRERLKYAEAEPLIKAGRIKPGDLIFYYGKDQADPGRASVWLTFLAARSPATPTVALTRRLTTTRAGRASLSTLALSQTSCDRDAIDEQT